MDKYVALKHAVKAHAGQLDKSGNLYVLHPIAVADAIDDPLSESFIYAVVPSAIIVALLHDVLEDTKYMLDPDDFTAEEWEALQLVTQKEGDTYFEYIEKIAAAARAGRNVAAIVKLSDLAHNLSASRQAGLGDAARGLEKRYLKARSILWDALGSEWWPA